jgi:hypothetical protein
VDDVRGWYAVTTHALGERTGLLDALLKHGGTALDLAARRASIRAMRRRGRMPWSRRVTPVPTATSTGPATTRSARCAAGSRSTCGRWSRSRAARTNTFLGERYRRLVKRRGKLKALVAVARSILVIVWHLLSDPTVRFHDLGPDFHTRRINTAKSVT